MLCRSGGPKVLEFTVFASIFTALQHTLIRSEVKMARVTVEDCVEKVSSRFELVMLAAQRSRNISAGSEITVERDNDKNPVVALREIADETTSLDGLKEELVQGLQKHVEVDEPEEEDAMEMIAAAALAGEENPLADEPLAAQDEVAAGDDKPKSGDISYQDVKDPEAE